MHSNVIIFAGPTIGALECHKNIDCIILPPAKQGDIYESWIKYSPTHIALIDGHFENTASPWHKEILYVLSQGARVYGSSSMGALRAAELNHFGMIGYGEIFEAYASEYLEDDDEVAVLHGPEATNYLNLSEAMVNIRKTLEAAYLDNIIARDCYDFLIDDAKQSFYKERSYPQLIKKLESQKQWSKESVSLENWLISNKIDQKKQDALGLLKKIKIDIKNDSKPPIIHYHFENTNVWKRMQELIHEQSSN